MKWFYSRRTISTRIALTLLIHGLGDTAVDGRRQVRGGIGFVTANVTHQLVGVPGQNHACDIEPFGRAIAHSSDAADFLDYVFR